MKNTTQPTPTPSQDSPEYHVHGPENAEHEIRKAYNPVIDSAMEFFWDRRAMPGVNPHEALTMYKHAFNRHREGDQLAAERWARSKQPVTKRYRDAASADAKRPTLHRMSASYWPKSSSSRRLSAPSMASMMLAPGERCGDRASVACRVSFGRPPISRTRTAERTGTLSQR